MLDKISTNFKKKIASLYFLKHLTSPTFLLFCLKIGNYYLIKLGVGHQEIKTENMLFQDIFFYIKAPLQ